MVFYVATTLSAIFGRNQNAKFHSYITGRRSLNPIFQLNGDLGLSPSRPENTQRRKTYGLSLVLILLLSETNHTFGSGCCGLD
ncbi:hypothetical protein NPIL_399071 [Nephila pilipes]|uniref:Uncharacterized protein n=1 Tax=Nephila pilipes TaxID=299642 RepID=A0A8X6QYH7_NEPPI|nr:hypothetical protein NPIL_399071 [Nephila pilipes]